jgi:SWI/SNF-related matrix-associated actin-dependent regulator 1 of chromatin subfamily A
MLPDPRAFNIVNYDIVWREPLISALKRVSWPVMVCDEAHFLKNKDSKRTKALIMRKGLYNNCKHRWMLTGTPVLNRPEELYPILRALTPEILGPYIEFYQYAYKFCGAFQDTYGFNTTGASNLDMLSGMLMPIMLRRLKSEVLKDLPAVTFEKVYLDPTDKLMAMIKKEKEQAASEVIGEISSLRRALGELKLPAAIQHLEDLLEVKQKVVVFAWHTNVIQGIKDHFGNKAVIYTGSETAKEKEEAIDAFVNRKEVNLFVGQLKAAGVGIDGLQKVCDVCVFVEMSYVPGEILQAVDRLCRIGQDNPVLAQFLIAEESMDEELVNSLTRKSGNIRTILNEEGPNKFAASACGCCGEYFELAKLRPSCGMAVCRDCEKGLKVIG